MDALGDLWTDAVHGGDLLDARRPDVAHRSKVADQGPLSSLPHPRDLVEGGEVVVDLSALADAATLIHK